MRIPTRYTMRKDPPERARVNFRVPRPFLPVLCLTFLLASCSRESPTSAPLYRAPPIPNQVDGVRFDAGDWTPHLPAGERGVSWGNHRAVVRVEETDANAVRVEIPWRRHDADPASRGVIVVDAATGEPVRNTLILRAENVSGEVLFQPNPGSTTYHAYYMPWESTGGYYPSIRYPSPEELRGPGRGGEGTRSPSRADQPGSTEISWEGKVRVNDPTWETGVLSSPPEAFPLARTLSIQSVDGFHSFFPMEVIATPEEALRFMEGASEGWKVVPEHRDYPVRMRSHLPWHWTGMDAKSRMPDLQIAAEEGAGVLDPAGDRESSAFFASRVLRDESFAFQLALISGEEDLQEVQLEFLLPPTLEDAATCFNCGGIDEKGEPFTKEISVPARSVQPLWIGIQIPRDHPTGWVEGEVVISTANRGRKRVPILLEVLPSRAENHGYNEPALQTRLAWLNSTVGTDPDFIISPFEPVQVEEPTGGDQKRLSILGRRLVLGPSGLPRQIYSFFTPELKIQTEEADPILARPMSLVVSGATERDETFSSTPYQLRQEHLGSVEWTVSSTSDNLQMLVQGRLEYDGMLDYRIALIAHSSLEISDIALPIALQPEAAEYMLGLGRKGGRRPASVDWKWAVENHQEGVWLGGIHKGLQYVLRDENYVRPLNTNFYRNQPLNLPPSWYNGGQGGIRIREEGGEVIATNYSGQRKLAPGDTLHFNIRFLITPFKPIDTQAHFNTRFVHQFVPVDSVLSWGGTVVNIHHANQINPYINYPFFNLEEQGTYIAEAHEKGIKVKLYNTIRELTYKAHELLALRSLGDEILNDGEGGGHSWMQEHLEDRYHSAWHAWRVDDAAMLNKGTSRWTNYYIEGLSWLAEHQHIDGLYLDDIAFSRETVKRIVTVLHEHRDEVVIDLHSANQFNVRDGFINSAMLYMEHFPFISRLWFGEYFEYDLDEDYWLTEVSGLPFGLMGEMLQDGGHPYRGMLYGMTARKYGNVDPRPVWAMMNDFGISQSRMMGYWLPDTPVTTDHPRVLATTYVGEDAILIALASWSDEEEVVEVKVDWSALGLAGDLRISSPHVEGLQEGRDLDLSAIPVPAGMGLWILMEKRGPREGGPLSVPDPA